MKFGRRFGHLHREEDKARGCSSSRRSSEYDLLRENTSENRAGASAVCVSRTGIITGSAAIKRSIPVRSIRYRKKIGGRITETDAVQCWIEEPDLLAKHV